MRFNQEYVDHRVLDIDHHYGQYERSTSLAAYHKYVLGQAVKLAELQPGMRILDYGCGRRMLRHALPPGVEYHGYDIAEEFSDTNDFRSRNYDAILAIQVLQYPNEAGLRELSKVFAQLSEKLIVMLPSSSGFKNFLDLILGLKEDADATFRSEPKLVYKVLEDFFELERMKNLLGVGELSRWARRRVE